MEVISQHFDKAKSITLLGHSSGGHECAMLVSTSWNKLNDDIEKYFQAKLKRVVVFCGVVDVTQLLATSLNESLDLSW